MASSTTAPVLCAWNPFRRDALFWAGQHGRLRRYLVWASRGHALVVLASVLLMLIPGCKRTYDLVKGSGKPKAMITQMRVEVRKVPHKHILVNPDSPIIFDTPPIDDTPLNLKEATADQYQIGQGDGA